MIADSHAAASALHDRQRDPDINNENWIIDDNAWGDSFGYRFSELHFNDEMYHRGVITWLLCTM